MNGGYHLSLCEHPITQGCVYYRYSCGNGRPLWSRRWTKRWLVVVCIETSLVFKRPPLQYCSRAFPLQGCGQALSNTKAGNVFVFAVEGSHVLGYVVEDFLGRVPPDPP